MSVLSEVDPARRGEFCRKWKIAELALFGSALRPDFGPASDIDVLVTFAPDSHPSLFDLAQMEEELKEIFAREVDLVSWRGLENSRNYIRRKALLDSARVIDGREPSSQSPRGGKTLGTTFPLTKTCAAGVVHAGAAHTTPTCRLHRRQG
jgi:hypothetical protein